jgi:hypothetical protein
MGAGLAVTSLLALQVFSGVGQAANPAGWSMTVIQQPEGIGGNTNDLAGFEITISNTGPSNIAQLFFIDTATGGPTVPSFLLIKEGHATCVTTPDLKCDLSPLNAGEHVTIVVAYNPTGSSFTYTPEANTTGVPSGKNNSHGDSLFADPKTYVTTVSSNRNVGGSFLPDGGSVANDTKFTGPNTQSVEIFGIGPGVGASVEDGLPNNAFSCSPACDGQSFVGQWSKIRVDGGRVQSGAFKVVITIKTSQNFTQAELDEIVAYHVLDDPDPDDNVPAPVVIVGDGAQQTPGDPGPSANERCATPNQANDPLATDGCIHAEKVGGNLVLTFWLTQNGGMRR